jgi:hypothetical protein
MDKLNGEILPLLTAVVAAPYLGAVSFSPPLVSLRNSLISKISLGYMGTAGKERLRIENRI